MGPNALNSTLYALAFNEVVGRGRLVGHVAGAAISDRRADASLAEQLRLVRIRTALVGASKS